MRRFVSLLVPTALAIAGCNSGSSGAASGVTSAAPVPAPASAAVSTPTAPRRPPTTREGGSLVRAATDDALYVADEDHGVVRRIPLPFDPAAPVGAIAMPGLPAQVLALADRVLVTVRSEGGVPPSAPARDAASPGAPPGSAASAAGKPPRSAGGSRIPVSPTGPGLLLILRPDPAAGRTGR